MIIVRKPVNYQRIVLSLFVFTKIVNLLIILSKFIYFNAATALH